MWFTSLPEPLGMTRSMRWSSFSSSPTADLDVTSPMQSLDTRPADPSAIAFTMILPTTHKRQRRDRENVKKTKSRLAPAHRFRLNSESPPFFIHACTPSYTWPILNGVLSQVRSAKNKSATQTLQQKHAARTPPPLLLAEWSGRRSSL